MRLQDVMTTDVITVDSNTKAAEAREMLRAENIHHLLVLDESGAVVGIVSDRDLASARGKRLERMLLVSDVMHARIITASPRTTVREAANLLRGHSVGCLPVVDERGRAVGIVTVSDLLELIGRGLERPTANTERPSLRHHRGPRYRPEARSK